VSDPFLKFYTSDWRADPRLKMCSPAARGMWIEMICLMHEATPYGHLLVHGQNPTEAQLASLTGIQIAELGGLIAELERNGVFSRTREGVIYSPEMAADQERFSSGLKRPAVPLPVRRAVLERDGQRCVYCGCTEGPFHLDHVIPWSRGGQHTTENMVVACQPCNAAKSDMNLQEWRGYHA